MNVYLTVDTEVWPALQCGWPHKPLPAGYTCEREYEAYILGRTASGDFGLPFQLEMLRRYGLKATYFVDPLFSFALGIHWLRNIVQMIESAGQRIGLHLHPEWLTDVRSGCLPRFKGPRISHYSLDEQRALIRIGLERLREAGAVPLSVFRAGSWGADVSTLEALRHEGIAVDSSLNSAFAGSFPSLHCRSRLQEPSFQCGVLEFPVTRFDDRVSKLGRPLSVVGTSWMEMHNVLERCERGARRSVVIVLHSNELVKTERLQTGRSLTPRRVAMRRFDSLCKYLSKRADKLSVCFMPEKAEATLDCANQPKIPTSTIIRTGARMASQVVARWF